MVKMRKKLVKNTTGGSFEALKRVVLPQLCRGCGARGGYLCERCKKYLCRGFRAWSVLDDGVEEREITKEEKEWKTQVSRVFRRVEFLGFRDEILGELVEEFKYDAVRGIGREIGELVFLMYFSKLSREFPEERIFLVGMPTSRKHIRGRGFDHVQVVVRRVSSLSRGKIEAARLLVRARDSVQVGASEKVRKEQAREAVRVNPAFLGEDGKVWEEIRRGKVVLLDDVWTTGASMIEAGKKLRDAGVEELFGVTITRNREGASPTIRRGEMRDLVK